MKTCFLKELKEKIKEVYSTMIPSKISIVFRFTIPINQSVPVLKCKFEPEIVYTCQI